MILVTGGAGFIGSAIVKKLNDLGEENIIITDYLEDSVKWKNLQSLKFDSYVDADDLARLPLDDISEIFHMGACSTTTEEDMDLFMRLNVDYSKELFQLAVENEIPFIYASSAATYGDGQLGYSDDHQGISKLRALNRYGYSKQLFDEWVLRQEQKPPSWAGLKFFNVYGPNEYHKGAQSSVIFQAYNQIKERSTVRLFKSYKEGYLDGEQLRDFVYIRDVVQAIIRLRGPNTKGIYNIGTGKARTFKDLAIATFKALDTPVNIQYIDMPSGLANQYQYHTEAVIDKLLGTVPDMKFCDLEEGIRDYVQNYLMKPIPYL